MNNTLRTIFFLFSMVFLVCACSKAEYQAAPNAVSPASMKSSAQQLSYDASAGRGEAAGQAGDEAPPPSQQLGADNTQKERKLVKKAELRLRVEDPAATEKPLAALMEKYGAWPAQATVYENSREYTIRVPLSSYNAMLADLAALGKTLKRTETAEDVTLRFYDLESRLATKRELLKTYRSYLGRAKNIDEIMTVESRIADLQQEIDRTGTQLRNLANLVDYSTIDLEIVGPSSVSSYAEPTLKEKLSELFGSFGTVASTALVVLTGIIIYGVPAILVLILLFWILFGRIGLLKKLWRLAVKK